LYNRVSFGDGARGEGVIVQPVVVVSIIVQESITSARKYALRERGHPFIPERYTRLVSKEGHDPIPKTYWTETPKMVRAAASSGTINEWA
jgi:hypothetical protein